MRIRMSRWGGNAIVGMKEDEWHQKKKLCGSKCDIDQARRYIRDIRESRVDDEMRIRVRE